MYKRIYESELKPAGEYKYSDLGYYLIHKMFDQWWETENAIDSLSQDWVYEPLGLKSMGFHPLQRFDKSEIAPSENDKIFREAIVRGTVHDPGAHMLGGVCCHAGLFSDAHDLARFGQMLLNGGVYNGHNVLKKETIEKWTQRTYPDEENRRGIGFDKKGLNPDEGVASLLSSDTSFGHSGFTGTLLWVDPEYDLVYVFLSNRTYPDSDNSALIEKNVRTVIHDIIMEHIMEEAK
jgi:CubicO group peptidase (beta-lactamase class C family)